MRTTIAVNCLMLNHFPIIENKHSCFAPGRMERIDGRAQHVNIV